MAKLHDFLVKGQLGDVHLGMRLEQVQQIWRPAPDRSLKRRPVEILRYGSVELTFGCVPDIDDMSLISAAIYFYNPDRTLPPKISFQDWTPTGESSEEEFKKYLASQHINVHSRIDGENTSLILESGASVVFAEGRLHSIHYSRRDRGAVRRQMSVSIPETSLDQLRERARREKIPLNKLIERILSSNV